MNKIFSSYIPQAFSRKIQPSRWSMITVGAGIGVGTYYCYSRDSKPVSCPQNVYSTEDVELNLLLAIQRLKSLRRATEPSFHEIEAIRKLKKIAKSTLTASSPASLKENYQQMVDLYDEIVMNNDDLKLLRGISQRIRDPSFDLENTISYPLCVFLSLTSPMEPNLFKSINYSKTINSSNRSEIYATRRSAFINEAKFAQSKHIKKFWQQHKITWLHGSSSSNLPSILNYGGILPAGLLLQEGGSPNGGKLLGNHNHFNATQNSGEIFSQNFVPSRDGLNAISHLKSAASRFLVCQLYGTSILRGGESKQIDSYTSYTQIINTLTHHSKEDSISNTDAISTYASILYLRKSTPTEPAILRNILQMFINPHNPSHHLLSAALTQSVTPYSTKDLKFINEQFPIIWASSTLHPKAAIPPNDITEYTTQGKARLGIDLPIAFAPQKYIETLQETLKPHAVQVFPLTHGGYLELKNIMAHGGIEIKPSKKMP